MTEPLLSARGIVKTFGAVQALRGANFDVFPGEVVALMGDNGAGKSTLVKVLCGVYRPDEGDVLFEGRVVHPKGPRDIQKLGIDTVHQDLALAPDLNSAANFFLGRELFKPGLLGRFGVLAKKAMLEETRTSLAALGVNIRDLKAPVAALSGGQRQSVAVVRAATWAEKVVIMDEPTAALGVIQTRGVLELIGRIRESGCSVVLISHNVPNVFAVSDRIEVLRLGRRVARLKTTECSEGDVVAAMTGAMEEVDA